MNNQKDLFLKHVLFDVSYGTVESYGPDEFFCHPKMTKYFPVYTPDGTFYNFQFYTPQELRDLIGIDDYINNIIKLILMKQYKEIINKDHLNYRRKIKGDTLAHQFPEYNELTSPDDIMQIIINKLNVIIIVFEMLGLMNEEKKKQIDNLFTNYYEHEPYNWFGKMINMFNN
jgi:hypothetical protein